MSFATLTPEALSSGPLFCALFETLPAPCECFSLNQFISDRAVANYCEIRTTSQAHLVPVIQILFHESMLNLRITKFPYLMHGDHECRERSFFQGNLLPLTLLVTKELTPIQRCAVRTLRPIAQKPTAALRTVLELAAWRYNARGKHKGFHEIWAEANMADLVEQMGEEKHALFAHQHCLRGCVLGKRQQDGCKRHTHLTIPGPTE